MSTARTQRQRILVRLTQGGLCGMEPLSWSPPITRVGARIYDLRQTGMPIVTQTKCPEHNSAHAYYKIDYQDQLFDMGDRP